MRGWFCGAGRGNRHPPVVISKAWPPIGRPQQRLYCTGQVHEHVAHQEEPGTQKGPQERQRCKERQKEKHRGRKGEKGKGMLGVAESRSGD